MQIILPDISFVILPALPARWEYKECSELKEVINLVEEHLHKKYYLINCLKKGVAFHFGNLPQPNLSNQKYLSLPNSIGIL
jgi:hypothetical protein